MLVFRQDRRVSILNFFFVLSFSFKEWDALDRFMRLGQHSCDLEHFTGAFAVACGDAWSVDVEETAFLEEFVSGIG